MHFEHVALNVPDPVAMADWYVEHCGLQIVRQADTPVPVRFCADATGRVILEIYNNPADAAPDYASLHPLRLHVAFAVEDAAAERDRLIDTGAGLVEEIHADDGSHLVMLRDPWQVPLQLCRRGKPLWA
jgi:catechol 2,3-dioxygenase-like lactoylglutathione lyase family enzyme